MGKPVPAYGRAGSGRDERSEKRKRGGAHGEPITESSKLLEGLCHAAAATTVGFAATPSTALAEGEDASAGEIKRIRSCCRACGKVECGVWVTVQDNKVIKVEGDESNAHSRGHCCAKSQSSMHAAYHPDRLRYPREAHEPQGSDDPGWVRITLARPSSCRARAWARSSISTADSPSSLCAAPRACGRLAPTRA